MHKLKVVLEFEAGSKGEGREAMEDIAEFLQPFRTIGGAQVLGVEWDGEYADDELDGWNE